MKQPIHTPNVRAELAAMTPVTHTETKAERDARIAKAIIAVVVCSVVLTISAVALLCGVTIN